MATKTVLPNGLQEWRNKKGQLHRKNGPAVISPDGTKRWYQYGELHREDGPAVIYSDGSQAWYQYDELHREDGAAVIWPDGIQEWWINGKRVDPPTNG